MKSVSVDLSVGAEKCPIDILCKDDTLQGPPHFKYVRCSFRHSSAHLQLPGRFKKGEFCNRVCGKGCGVKRRRCKCAHVHGGLPPYAADGLLHPHYITMVSYIAALHFFIYFGCSLSCADLCLVAFSVNKRTYW